MVKSGKGAVEHQVNVFNRTSENSSTLVDLTDDVDDLDVLVVNQGSKNILLKQLSIKQVP